MLVAGLILMFFESNTAHVIYDCFGVLLFSIYIIYDTQLILGNGKYSLEIDDYVFAALNLYIDVV
jgi:FtsH-binding integral membrane protein